MNIKKRYYYKIYNSNYKYLTTWSKEVISMPTFRSVINGGVGELQITLAKKYNDFDEGNTVTLGNRVELWCADADNLSNNLAGDTLWDSFVWDVDDWDTKTKSFVKIYSGYISQYSPTLDDEDQTVAITLLGYGTETSYRILKDGSGNTTVTYTNEDPSIIMMDIIDKYRADGGVNLSYTGSSIQYTGLQATYTFKENTIKEALDYIIGLCPDDWYYFIDPNGIVYLQSSQILMADHRINIGKDIALLETNKRIENLTNRLYITGGGGTPLYYRYDRIGSQTTYGVFERKLQNGTVTDSTTADLMAKRILDRNEVPEQRSIIRIIDNNGEDSYAGQNIESYRVGDTVQIKNLSFGAKGETKWDLFQWDVDVWDATASYGAASILTIVSIIYNYDNIEIEASSRLPEVPKRIEQVSANVDTLYQENLPTAPTLRTI